MCKFFYQFWQEIVLGVTYVLSAQYSCAVVFLKNDNSVSLFQRNNSLAKIYFLLSPNFLLLHIFFLFSINQHCYNHNCFSKNIEIFLKKQKLINNRSITLRQQSQIYNTFLKTIKTFPNLSVAIVTEKHRNFLRKQKIVNNCIICSMHAVKKLTILSD